METQVEELPPGVIDIGGDKHMINAAGHKVPLELVDEYDLLEDQTVRKIIGFAVEESERVSRFRGHTFDDVTAFVDLYFEKYGKKRGGKKGNITLTSFDGCLKVEVKVQDLLTFGPALQVAKAIVDECVANWSDGGPAEVRALLAHAFQVDKEGKINTAALFQLRRIKIEREPWPAAMKALSDAIRVIGSREYVRFYRRPDQRAKWTAITVDLSSVAGGR